MLQVWLEIKDKSRFISGLMLKSRNCDIKLRLPDHSIESGSSNYHVTIVLHNYYK